MLSGYLVPYLFGVKSVPMVRSVWLVVLVACASLSAGGCVKKALYDAQTEQLTTCKRSLGTCGQSGDQLKEQLRLCDQQLAKLRETIEATKSRANQDLGELQRSLDDATVLNASLRAELERLGGNVDSLVKEKGALTSSLEAVKARLEELRRAQAAAERRTQQMHQLVQRFRKMADAGQLAVGVRRGRMVLQLPADVLFDSARAALKPAGRQTIVRIATVLRGVRDRQFQVAGHTDDQPIASKNYPSNWYLSVSRAIKVVEILVHAGVKPSVLSASGYGEFDPIVPNDSAANRQRNRRIEIVIQPNVDEFLAIPNQPSWGD